MKEKGALVTLSSLLLIFALIGLYALAFNQSATTKAFVNELTALNRLQEKKLNNEFNIDSLFYGNRDLNIDFNQGIVFFKQFIPLNANIPTQFDLNALTYDVNNFVSFIKAKETTDYNYSYDVNFGLNALTFTIKPFNTLVRQAVYSNLSKKGIEVIPEQLTFRGYAVRLKDENYSSIQGTINSGAAYYLELAFDNNVTRYNVSSAVLSDFNLLTVSGKTVNIKLNSIKPGSLSTNLMTNATLSIWAGIDYSNQASIPWIESNLIDFNLSKDTSLVSKK